MSAVTRASARPQLPPPADRPEPQAGLATDQERHRHGADGAVLRARPHPARLRPGDGARRRASASSSRLPQVPHRGHPDHQPVHAGRAWVRPSSARSSSPARRRPWPCRSASSAPSTCTSTAASAAFARFVRFMSDVMTGVPSIVMGLFIYRLDAALRPLGLRRRAGAGLPDAADRHPQRRGDAQARPRRPAGGQLRARRPQSRTILTVVLPSALPGIVSGCLLAVARPQVRRRPCCSPSAT